MNLTDFAIWRFRNAEGVMDYVESWNATECRLNVNGKHIKITYDIEHEIATISNLDNEFMFDTKVSFKDFVSTLTSLGYYKERTVNRHSLSYKDRRD
jgi:hypothetical protein